MPILKNETNYLGFKITGNGIKPDTEKVETIRSLPAPINVKEVRSFIGMLSYYRRFVPNFSKISIPLVELTKKYAKFNWTDECQRAFEYLKDSLTVIPLLAYPDLTKRYTLYTDASDDTIGACLTQPCNDNEEVLYGGITVKLNGWLGQKTLSRTISRRPNRIEVNKSDNKKTDDEDIEIDISNKAYEINTINSNEIDPKKFASCSYKETDTLTLKDFVVSGYDMKYEQSLDKELALIISQMKNGKASKSVESKYILIDEIMYYISKADTEPVLRLYVPLQLRDEVVKQYHDQDHLGVDKTYDAIKEEIIPKHSFPLQILTDNGGENTSYMVRETLQELNISHVTTSFYSPGSNGKVERLHRFLHDILAKKIQDDASTWDVYLNQTLAAIRFNKNESSDFSPFFLLYNRDPVLPVDNILRPRRQAVFYRNHLRKSKLDSKWKPFYRIIEQRSPVSFIIKNQLNGNTTKVHAQHLKPAPVNKWTIPKLGQADKDKQLRKTTYVVPPESSDKESENETDSENSSMEGVEQTRDKLIRRYKNERESSSGEDDIPLMELTKRVKYRKKRIKAQYENTTDEEDNIPLLELQNNLKSRVTTSETRSISLDANSSEDEAMSVNHFIEKPARYGTDGWTYYSNTSFGFGELAFISDNIVFDKVNTVTTTRSKWLVTFIIDLKPFEGFLNRISHDMVKSSALAQTVLRRYEQPGKEHFYNTFSNLEQEFNLLMDMHRSITDSFDDFKTLHRHRRSVLPFIGSAMSFLFGTLTEDDINLIKGNVRTLAQNQKKISHILTENLSILNITRLEVSQNRDAINKLSRGLQDLDIRLVNITEAIEKQIIDLENFVQIYIQLDLITGDLKQLIQRGFFYLEHIKDQLSMLSLGHLSPSTITPNNLQGLLIEIKDKLPKYLELTNDPKENLWFFYRFLTCSTILYDSRILVVISIPLLDSNNKFEIYQAFNLPMPMQKNHTNIALNETCTATNDYLTLLPFYSRQSSYTLEDDPFTKVIQNYNLTMRKLWKPFHDSLPKFNLTELPKELKNIKEIPMDNLSNGCRSKDVGGMADGEMVDGKWRTEKW
ncbi:unnamed protein product [Mytilus coruscus]|uniref:Integrase catalytic domain-containing protein n=1 Tax=Mytilus coruscus TaxID=42192 RepID=A0A6J8E5Y1_MYTCO|nr:unnamed protein product [Mytilus coruscus]